MASNELTRFDTLLLEGAAGGKSAAELSVSVGGTLSPAECLVRVRSILHDRDVWSDPERRKLLLHRVHTLVDDLADQADRSKDSADFSALIRGLDLLRKVLAEQGQATEEELQRLVQMQAQAMLGFITQAMERATTILIEAHPDIERETVEEAFDLAMAEIETSA